MMERLFAVEQQRSVFLLMAAGGVALGFLLDIARYLRRILRHGAIVLDIVPALGLLVLLVGAVAAGREALRLYSLLGIALGGALYAAGLAPALSWLASGVKKLLAARRSSRKNGAPGEST